MFGRAGYAYIYMIYGMYYCFNIVTEREGYPAAVLIRAVEPVAASDQSLHSANEESLVRRQRITDHENQPGSSAICSPKSALSRGQATNGPGKVCRYLKIDKTLNGIDLCGSELYIEDRGEVVGSDDIIQAKRIGVDYAGEWKDRPWRFYIKGNKYVSKAEKS